MDLITRFSVISVPLALGVILATELLCIVWCMARVVKQSTKQTAILERIAATLSQPVAPEDIANPHASPELLGLVGDYPSDFSAPPKSPRWQRVTELSLGGYNKRG